MIDGDGGVEIRVARVILITILRLNTTRSLDCYVVSSCDNTATSLCSSGNPLVLAKSCLPSASKSYACSESLFPDVQITFPTVLNKLKHDETLSQRYCPALGW